MTKKNIEDLLRENLKREVPKELDEKFYQFTSDLKETQETSRPMIWKSALAFSFVLALFVYNYNYQGETTPSFAEAEILDNVELLNNMEVLADVEELSDEEFELLMEEGNSDEV